MELMLRQASSGVEPGWEAAVDGSVRTVRVRVLSGVRGRLLG